MNYGGFMHKSGNNMANATLSQGRRVAEAIRSIGLSEVTQLR